MLAEASELLRSPLDAGRILALTGQVAVPRLAKWCAVLTAGPDAKPTVLATRHADSASGALSWLLEQGRAGAPWPAPRAGQGGHHAQPAAGARPLAAGVPRLAPARGRADLRRPRGVIPPAGHPGQRTQTAGAGQPALQPPSPGSAQPSPGPGRADHAHPEESRLAAQQARPARPYGPCCCPPSCPGCPECELTVTQPFPAPGPRPRPRPGREFCDVFPAGRGGWQFSPSGRCAERAQPPSP